MPINIRKDGAAKRIAIDILGPPSGGLTDSCGNKKRYVKKKRGKNSQEESQFEESRSEESRSENNINRFDEIGYR